MKRLLTLLALILLSSGALAATQVQDSFTDIDGTEADAHTPDIDVVGNGWTALDYNTGAALAANVAEIQSNKLVLTGSNLGAVIDHGQTNFIMEFDWTTGVGANRILIPVRFVIPHNGTSSNALYVN